MVIDRVIFFIEMSSEHHAAWRYIQIECETDNHLILSRGPTLPGRYANSTRGVQTRPVVCGSFILQSWWNVKVQILKITVMCSQDWVLINYRYFIILRLNMASVEAIEEKGPTCPGLPYNVYYLQNVYYNK